MKKVLLIDDDKALQHRVKHALEAEGFDVSLAVNDINTLAEKASLAVDMIILDFNAAMSDSIDILRKKSSYAPVILISSSDTEQARIKAFEHDADDFLAKPFNDRELVVRIKAIERRLKPACRPVPHRGVLTENIHFDHHAYRVMITGKELRFTQTEFKLFKYLFDRKGHVIDKKELQRSVLHKELGRYDRNLDMHVSNTRRKLAKIALPKSLINTVRGKGYSFAK